MIRGVEQKYLPQQLGERQVLPCMRHNYREQAWREFFHAPDRCSYAPNTMGWDQESQGTAEAEFGKNNNKGFSRYVAQKRKMKENVTAPLQ